MERVGELLERNNQECFYQKFETAWGPATSNQDTRNDQYVTVLESSESRSLCRYYNDGRVFSHPYPCYRLYTFTAKQIHFIFRRK